MCGEKFTFWIPSAELSEVGEFWYWMEMDADWHFEALVFWIAQFFQNLLVFIPIMTAIKKLRNSTACFIEAKYSLLPWEFCLEKMDAVPV